MRLFSYRILLLPAFILLLSNSRENYAQGFILQSAQFGGNHISTWVHSTGVFNQDFRSTSHPGFQWPAGEGRYAVFTTGLSIAAYVNGQLREAMASYTGEFFTGYIMDSVGIPVPKTDNRFKVFAVKRTDNWINNPYWLNWGLMVPFGAPYVDVNHNGIYEPLIDTPGVRGADMTVFECITDGFEETHSSGEGFGGGTLPLYTEIHFIAWSYNKPGLEDVQFIKWNVINKNNSLWDSTYFSIVCDPDLGYASDDYVGCDTVRNMSYCYNGDNDDDEEQLFSYGLNPPAVGFDLLMGPENKNVIPPLVYSASSLTYFLGTSTPGPACEKDPNGEQYPAYQMMKGYKKDGTPWVIPNTNPPQITKFCYTGDPETQTGWTESKGSVYNCGGSLYGTTVSVNPVGDRRIVMSSGSGNFKVNAGDTQTIMIAQFIARGTSNLNSVTKLKQLDDFIQAFVNNGFVIGVQPISNNIPGKFILHQNYPNPFNPATKIEFEIPNEMKSENLKVKIIIYDVLGREVEVLVNEKLSPGTYEVSWDAHNYPSGVYFYRLIMDNVFLTKKMVLLK